MLWPGGNHPLLKITFYTIMSITQDDTDGLPKPHARNVSKWRRRKDSKTNKRKKTTMAAAGKLIGEAYSDWENMIPTF